MRLKTKFAAFLLVVVALLAAAVYGGFQFYRAQTVAEERAEIDETATMTANDVDDTIRDTRASLASSAIGAPTLDVDLRQALVGRQTIGAKVVASNGSVLKARGQANLLAAHGTAPDYVAKTSDGETFVADPVWLPEFDRYATAIAAPLVVNGSVQGTLVATTYVDTGKLFARDVGESVGVQVLIAESNRTVERERNQSGLGRWIAGSATVESTDWTVTVRRSAMPLRAQLQTLAVLQGLGLAVILLPVGGFAIWEYYQNIRQVRRLRDGLDALGKGEYDHSMSLSTSDEWRQIEEGYERVTQELADRERALRDREQRVSVLSRVLRHNLRNDLGAITSLLRHVRRRADDGSVENLSSEAIDISRRLVSLSERAREVERALETAERGPVRHDLVRTVDRVVDDLRPEYPDATIETNLPDSAPVAAIPALAPAVRNVVQNACEHAGDRPTVEIELEYDASDRPVTLTVRDDGPGIPDHEANAIEEGIETALEHGSGLGLWLVKWLVEKSGGTLSIDHDDGTEVTLRFQRPTPEAVSERETRARDATVADGSGTSAESNS